MDKFSNINNYYAQMLEYRDILDKKVAKGKLDESKMDKLLIKINQWYGNHPNHPKTVNMRKKMEESKKGE